MAPRATVLIPTFDHGDTLGYAVRSALAQTVTDIEIFIVGDGVPHLARMFVEELIREDPRIRFFANDKGPRHGEIHRGKALEEASGEIVCYLSDDDLWLPGHIDGMLALLAEADFANCLPLRVEPNGTLAGWTINLVEESDRQLLLGGENRIPLSCSGHTLAAYRRLPFGWRTTPDDVPTDLFMFQQFLSQEWVRAASGAGPTCLHFPSPDRIGWTAQQRCAELDQWQNRVSDREWRTDHLTRLALGIQARGWARRDAEARAIWRQKEEFERALADVTGKYRVLEKKYRALEEQYYEKADEATRLSDTTARMRHAEQMLDEAGTELEWMRASKTWRIRQGILSLPVLGVVFRWVAGARSRRGAR